MRKGILLALVVMVMCLGGCGSGSHTVTITYMPDGGQLSMDIPAELQDTSTQIDSESPQWYPPAPFKQGHTFVNWYLDPGFQDLYSAQVLQDEKDITLYARYIESDQDEYFVVSFIAQGGTFTPNQLVSRGDLLTEPAEPVLPGYTFEHWAVDVSASGLSGPVDFSQPVQENMTLGAVYTRK